MSLRSKLLYRIAGVLLLVSAFTKFISVFGHARILKTMDPVFFMVTTKFVLLEVGILETAAACILIFGRSLFMKWMTLLILCLGFWSYRLGVLLVAPGRPCPCLGTIWDWSPWLRTHGDLFPLCILLFLTICLIICKPIVVSPVK